MEYLTQSQIAALIIGITFSIISIATTIISVKRADKLSSPVKAIATAVTAPFIASTSWLFLIFSFVDGFRTDETLTLIVAILLAIILIGMITIVAKALYNKHQEDFEAKDRYKEAKKKAKEERKKAMLLLNAPKEEKKKPQEIKQITEKSSALKEQEELAESEALQEGATTEEYDSAVDEVDQDTFEEDTLEEDDLEETTQQENEDTTQEAVEPQKNTFTEEEQEDLDFEKFLESLGKKDSSSENKDDK